MPLWLSRICLPRSVHERDLDWRQLVYEDRLGGHFGRLHPEHMCVGNQGANPIVQVVQRSFDSVCVAVANPVQGIAYQLPLAL